MNLEAIHKARENFLKAECSERIHRALRHKMRSYSDHHYDHGHDAGVLDDEELLIFDNANRRNNLHGMLPY